MNKSNHKQKEQTENGKKRKANKPDRTENDPRVTFRASGSVSVAVSDSGSSSEFSLAIYYTEFQVYRDSIDRYDFKQERKFDSLTIAMVDQCRLKVKKTVHNTM